MTPARSHEPWPLTVLVQQRLDETSVGDAAAAVARELEGLRARRPLPPGSKVAVAVGSRRLDEGPAIIRAVIQVLGGWGIRPLLVPAMGSHGGATAEGQIETLARLGITPDQAGAPIQAGLDVVRLGTLPGDVPVVMAAAAAAADAILVVNRIKSHTKFFGAIESGILKMAAVGLGQQTGAAALHRAAVDQGLENVIRAAARVIIGAGKIWGGLGVVENGRGQTALIKAMAAAEIEAEEEALLARAKAMAARIPFERLDLLIVDRIGKDISGIGMDSKVTGRHRDVTGDFDLPPRPKRIYVRGLSPGSGGNALGIGLADACHARVEAALDREVTLTNALTSLSLEKAALPAVFSTDAEGLAACLITAGRVDPDQVRLVHIRDTAHLEQMAVSTALAPEAKEAGLETISEPRPLVFDGRGDLVSPW
jgi:hypothetical protein